MSAVGGRAIDWAEQGLVPDQVIRAGIRRLLRQRLREIAADDCEGTAIEAERFLDEMDAAPIAPVPQRANEQHYQLPAAFFGEVLGGHRKYSCCYWPEGVGSLTGAEGAALYATCARAEIEDGMAVLDLGCGWGSLSLWIADRYPNARVLAVSNSTGQREYIEQQCAARGLGNLQVLTRDMNDFDPGARFDRIVSVEMFEHMRNYRRLFGRIRGWLRPDGLFLMHVFCHRAAAYEFDEDGPGDWMGRHFFAGGMMPSDDLPLRFQDDLSMRRRWRWSGLHYARTARAWLDNMDRARERIWPILSETYGSADAQRWWMRWRVFFMACEELFGYDGGQQWWVSHYLFGRRAPAD